ncbi:MAG: T9SS type A sorting domain-containing protein [Muribaculaceae bacterium]|nr:T9SS type A sorting domain-containing protein [Muribaculaceae bacterium]
MTVENDSYLISDIEKYTFSMPSNESGTGITNAETIAAFVNDNIHLSSEYALNSIHIVDLQGMEYPVAPRLTRGTGYVEINLQDLSPGIYILTIPDHSIKFIKK